MPTHPDNVAKNLEAISKAIQQHDKGCPGNIVAIVMHPIEVERLDFETFQGIPIEEDERQQTGTFRLVCDMEQQPDEAPETGDTADKREAVTA